MAKVKLTKMELRQQQVRLTQLQKYLPTLQLKKALLQAEVLEVQHELERIFSHFTTKKEEIDKYAILFSGSNLGDFFSAVEIDVLEKKYENIAGIEIPSLEKLEFKEFSYSLFDTPVWFDAAITDTKELKRLREEILVAMEKKRAIEKELREVSIRVNLFEKIMIPRAKENIKRIKIFLGDQQLAAVAQAKVSKNKILLRAKSQVPQEEVL